MNDQIRNLGIKTISNNPTPEEISLLQREDVVIIPAFGTEVGTRRKLEEKGISVALINPRWIKPIDTGTLEFFARGVEVVCTIEDHVLHNGFGCAVMEHLHSQMINTPVVRIGWPD